MTDVFISYKREERPRCVAIYNALVDLKLSVWFDGRIEPGTSFDREIEREVESAKAILVLWSELARNSDWIRNEARTGKQGERLVAARLDDCLPPLEFRSVQTVDLFDAGNFQSGEGWCQIASRIGRLVERPGLGDYVRCEQAADAAQWENWLAAHGDDPLAGKARERLAALIAGTVVDASSVAVEPEADPSPGVETVPWRMAEPLPPPAVPTPEAGKSADHVGHVAAFFRRHRWSAGLAAVAAATLLWLASGYGTKQRPADRVPGMADSAVPVPEQSASATPNAPVTIESAAASARAATEAAEKASKSAAAEMPEAATPAPKVAVADPPRRGTCNGGPYIVFFDWDSSSITPEAATILDNVVDQWGQCRGDVRIAGHTDRSASTRYSVGLSQRMANNVSQYLQSRGVAAGQISTEAYGETRPRIETADGVRELMNRRVEITLR